MSDSPAFANPRKKTIGLNGRFLVAQRTGVQRSAYRLFRTVIEQGDQFNFILFTGDSEIFAPEWQRPNVQVVTSPLSQRTVMRNHMWEQFELPRLAKRFGVDLLHSPANLAPIAYSGKSIVNIHDLCFLVQPAWFSLSFRLIYRWLVPKIARNSSIVVTNSNYSKNDILKFLRLSVDRIRLTYWSVDPIFYEFNQPLHMRDDRIIFVGSLEPRKNLIGLLRAFSIYKQRHPESQTRLTVVGCESPLFADVGINRQDVRKDVDFRGYISDRELAELFGRSRALIYPSFYEGFGFPPLEAMAAGTPVVTSRTSSLPEVVGDAALLVDPYSPEDIADNIARALNPETAATLARRGFEQVKKFSWDRVGQHMLAIYSEILAEQP
ncbi:MAG: glycosyltransferase family 1 protein [Proteobacteria bacterium]|nr:glycosyltransferase family 1 protein [Pseudomonadota bacterium]